MEDKHILILGAGISGVAAAETARQCGASVTLCDANAGSLTPQRQRQLQSAGVQVSLGDQAEILLDGVDYMIISPGIPLTASLAAAARRLSIPVISEVEFAYRISKSPLLAITGTNGKTTTTVLTHRLLENDGKACGIGGNVGRPLSAEAYNGAAYDWIVAEISSYQLESVHDFKPRIAAILNLAPDHLARHGTLANYQLMKERIFARQTAADCLVLNYDDVKVRAMGAKAAARVFYFSRAAELDEGAIINDGWFMIRAAGCEYPICAVADVKLPGGHNEENILAAVLMAFLAGVSPASMAATLRDFTGVEHRMEPVAIVDGVKYYNDSKATNPDSTIKALTSFDAAVILIAGGHDKNTDLTEFMQIVKQRVKALILIGAAAERFALAAETAGVTNVYQAGFSMAEAVTIARRLAVASDIVLLSPACASYDMYHDFDERGRDFKSLVQKLK